MRRCSCFCYTCETRIDDEELHVAGLSRAEDKKSFLYSKHQNCFHQHIRRNKIAFTNIVDSPTEKNLEYLLDTFLLYENVSVRFSF